LNTISDSPFPELKSLLADGIATRGNDSISVIRAYKENILKEARRALIEREATIVELQMQAKNVEVLSVSARQYMLCVDPLQDEEPKISPEATGIPALRRYLFSLPAQTNYRALRHHVFDTLPDLTVQITRILEKFSKDEDYNSMRRYLAEQSTKLRDIIQSLARSLPEKHVTNPWTANDKHTIIAELKSIIQSMVQPAVYYSTFLKMLRENGIPCSGKAKGRNLNHEVLLTMNGFIETWNVRMMTRTENLAAALEAPLGILLKNVKDSIGSLSGNPDLRQAADDALERTSRRLAIVYGKLTAALASTLRENYLHFTTETNVYCPFALELKPVYQVTIQQGTSQPGKGSYGRLRTHLSQAITHEPDWNSNVLTDRMEAKIIKGQVDAWSRCCDDFVKEVIALLEEFEQNTQELLDDGAHTIPEFRQAQKQLEAMLPQFNQKLQRVQGQFPGEELQQSTASEKRKRHDVRSETQPPESWSGKKRTKFSSQASGARAISTQPPATGYSTKGSMSVNQGLYGGDVLVISPTVLPSIEGDHFPHGKAKSMQPPASSPSIS
jgi:hypothetical protein